MPIIPDTKDWTWVLERPCAECGFTTSTIQNAAIADLIRSDAARWPTVLHRDNVEVRPNGNTWSPLEYSAHVRDVYRLFLVRLSLMLNEDDPVFPNWDQDETAIEQRYSEQNPAVVSGELSAAASALAEAFESISDEDWLRVGRRGDGARFTVSSFARYLLHDPAHHLWDVRG